AALSETLGEIAANIAVNLPTFASAADEWENSGNQATADRRERSTGGPPEPLPDYARSPSGPSAGRLPGDSPFLERRSTRRIPWAPFLGRLDRIVQDDLPRIGYAIDLREVARNHPSA